MQPTPEDLNKKQPGIPKKPTAHNDTLHHLAFDNSMQANIISTVSNGKIITANSAACKLLGYSKKDLLTKSRSALFDINETSFKKMLKQRTKEGHSIALVTVIKKSGKKITCEITSAVFTDEDGIEKAISTITNMSESILKQKNIDIEKEKVVAENIVIAISKQKGIDIKKERVVTNNIILAREKSDSRLAENNEWIKHIAKTSYDVMWDWNILTGEMYVGDSIKEVFGYKVQNNKMNFTDFISCLVPEEKDTVEKKLFQILASGSKSWKDSYLFKREDGSIASTTTRASIVRDEKGKAIHLIGNIQDVSRLQELENKLQEQAILHDEQTDNLHLAAKLSFDGIWDWNLLTNDFFLGEGFEDIFGITLNDKDKMTTDWSNFLHPDDKENVEQGMKDALSSSATHWERAYRFIRANGTIANVFCRANILRDADGKAYRMIGAVHDVSRLTELENKLKQEITTSSKLLTEYEENFKIIFNSSSDILYDIDLVSNEVTLSNAYEKELGYKIINNITSTEEFFSHIHPDDKEALMLDYDRMLISKDIEWKQNFRYKKADDSIANIVSKGIVLRTASGKAYRRIGYLLDISKQIVLEEKLELEIKLKEKQITDAIDEAREIERSDIGKELHDNINQLLSASKLYLDMAKRGGKDGEMLLSRSSEYTLLAIEEIRKLTKGLTTDAIKNLGLCESIDKLTRDMMQVSPVKISHVLNSFIEDSVSDKFKLNIFRIVQEQLNNILKHAKATKAAISILQNKRSIKLTIADNGVGFDTNKKREGIGVANIKSRATSYNGITGFASQPGQGCVLAITFPITEVLLN